MASIGPPGPPHDFHNQQTRDGNYGGPPPGGSPATDPTHPEIPPAQQQPLDPLDQETEPTPWYRKPAGIIGWIIAVAILLGILSSPHLYMHDWVVFVPGGVLLWRRMVHIPGRLNGSTRVLLGLLLASPFLFWFSQFLAWPPQSSIQLVPWYMGLLAMAAFVSIQGTRETSPASPHPAGD